MIILYQSTPEVKRILDDLLASGKYADYSEIISLAVMNLAVLQNEIEDTGEILFNEEIVNEKIFPSMKFSESDVQSSRQASREDRKVYIMRDMFLFESLVDKEPPSDLPRVEASEQLIDQVPIDKWIFGQHNRFLPVKVSCRALSNLMRDETNGVSLSKCSSMIANSAAELAQSLRKIDRKFNLKRDEALATAFPVSGKRRHKSIERYISQFIAQTTREGKLTGLPADYKFITKINDGNDRIILTDAGWKFAVLQNPVLDGSDDEPPTSLSQQEREFLIKHILQSVPVEEAAFNAIVGFIISGSNTPTLLDKSLTATLPERKLEKLSKSFFSSQRSGTISRMVDLGIVARERHGVYVEYSLTPTSDLFNTK
jgi:hypothetical protein